MFGNLIHSITQITIVIIPICSLKMENHGTIHVSDSQFLDEVSSIERSIGIIQTNIGKIKDIQAKIIASVATAQEFALAQERDQIMQATRDISIETKDSIKKVEIDTLGLRNQNPNHSDIKFRTQRHEFLKEKLTKVLQTYSEAENLYVDQRKEKIIRQYKVVYPDASQTEIDSYLENPSDQIFIFMRAGEAKEVWAEVRKRHSEIIRIERTIRELANLFNDLQLQVDLQDDTLINVGITIEETAGKIDNSTRHLTVATERAKSFRRKHWLCAIASTIIILITAIILILTLGER